MCCVESIVLFGSFQSCGCLIMYRDSSLGGSFVDPFCYLWFMFISCCIACSLQPFTTCWERIDLLVLLCGELCCVLFRFVTSHMTFHLILSIPCHCLTLYLCVFYLGSYQPFVRQFFYGIISGFHIFSNKPRVLMAKK